MLCMIADIKTSVPGSGGMDLRCREYRVEGEDCEAELVLDEALYSPERWPGASENTVAYMESARQFYYRLPEYGGMMLHASAIVIDGEAYLFAGQSGIGKSTHANLFKRLRPDAQFLNDDKPALRCMDGRWMAYGTPWSGKHGININAKYPLKAICLLTARRDRNEIRAADPLRAVTGIISCSARRGTKAEFLMLSGLIDRLVKCVPVYEMDSLADDAAANMAFNTMKTGITEKTV